MGLASQAKAAASRERSSACWCAAGQLRAAILKRALAIVGEQALHRFDQRRQRRFGIGGDGEVHFREALEVLIVALDVEIAGGDADQFRARLRDRTSKCVRSDRGTVCVTP